MSAPESTAPDPTRLGLVIGVGVGFIGITFGVLARGAGLDVGRTCAMSLLVFTGASQFAVVGVIGSGGTLAAALGTAILLAARNVFYGPVVSKALEGPLWKRFLFAHLIIDESAGVSAAQPDEARARRGFLATGLGVFVFWNIGTLIGAVAGDLIGDPGRFGLDAAFPAGFLALLAPHLKHLRGRAAACIGAGLALIAVPIVPVGVPVLLAAVAVLPAAAFRERPTP
ncbi:MAG TPA: AzlC family ABC transporter permease [Microthrixaceae bacterium]|nr:AzlC family ABC transporter permease [Microthrixaceae bacterium]